MGDNERNELAKDIAAEVARMMSQSHDLKCPHGYTQELREELRQVVSEWREMAPKISQLTETATELTDVAKLYRKGNHVVKTGIWGAFVIGIVTIVLAGIYEWFKKMVPVIILGAVAVVLLICSGCMSRRTTDYYPDGSVQREVLEEGFTLGTQGLGEYNFQLIRMSGM